MAGSPVHSMQASKPETSGGATTDPAQNGQEDKAADTSLSPSNATGPCSAEADASSAAEKTRGAEASEEQLSFPEEKPPAEARDGACADKPAEAEGAAEAPCLDENQEDAACIGEERAADASGDPVLVASESPQTTAAPANEGQSVSRRRSSRLQAHHEAANKPSAGRTRAGRASGPGGSGSDTGKAGRGSKRQGGQQKDKKKAKKPKKAMNPDDVDVTTSHDLKAVMDMWRETYGGLQARQAEGQGDEAERGGDNAQNAPGASKTVRWVNSADVKLQ